MRAGGMEQELETAMMATTTTGRSVGARASRRTTAAARRPRCCAALSRRRHSVLPPGAIAVRLLCGALRRVRSRDKRAAQYTGWLFMY